MININQYAGYFFDFDGVIADTVDIKTKAFAELYRPFGENIVISVVNHHKANGGMSRFDKIRHYHNNFLNIEITEAEIIELSQNFSNIVFQKVIAAPYIQGATDFLAYVDSLDKKMFIVSGTPEDEIRKIIQLRELSNYFNQDNIKGAPAKKTENLRELLTNRSLLPQNCIYFGDAEEDRRAADILNMAFIPINFYDQSRGYPNFQSLLNDITS